MTRTPAPPRRRRWHPKRGRGHEPTPSTPAGRYRSRWPKRSECAAWPFEHTSFRATGASAWERTDVRCAAKSETRDRSARLSKCPPTRLTVAPPPLAGSACSRGRCWSVTVCALTAGGSPGCWAPRTRGDVLGRRHAERRHPRPLVGRQGAGTPPRRSRHRGGTVPARRSRGGRVSGGRADRGDAGDGPDARGGGAAPGRQGSAATPHPRTEDRAAAHRRWCFDDSARRTARR